MDLTDPKNGSKTLKPIHKKNLQKPRVSLYRYDVCRLLLWIIIHNTNPDWWNTNGKPITYHYVNDFFANIAWLQFKSIIHWFDKPCVPTKGSKCKAPSTKLVILGFENDAGMQMVFIPKTKLVCILREIDLSVDSKEANSI